MVPSAKLFLDTSALFSGMLSPTGGARALLILGEFERIRLVVSPEVINELERVLRRKAPELLVDVACLLDRARLEIGKSGTSAEIERCRVLTGHQGDAHILAAALRAQVDFLVTLDREHLLGNPAVNRKAGLRLGTPGDALAWLRAGLV